MHWPGIEPGLPAWQVYHWTGTNALLKTDSVPYKRHCGGIFMVKIEKEKENKKTKQNKNKQTNIKGKVEKDIQIIQEEER